MTTDMLGKRVIITKDYPYDKDLKGKKGTIIERECITPDYWGVEFDEYMGGHDCDGKGKRGYCYRVHREYMQILKSEKITNWRKIVCNRLK